MTIRPAALEDFPALDRIYARARSFMKEAGNPTQWAPNYPSIEQLQSDLSKGALYVIEQNETVVGVFALVPGAEPTYREIDGAWHADAPYATIHRVASDGSCRGIAQACFDFCKMQYSYLRIDTHADNFPMQAVIRKAGFHPCGTIIIEDGSPRIAYDYLA